MSGNSRNSSRFWMALARRAANGAGFEGTRCPLAYSSYSLPSEISPSLQIFFQKITSVEVAPDAFIGVYVEAFELEWSDRLRRTGLSPNFENPPFLLLATNVPSLMRRPWARNSPPDQDAVAVVDWLDRAFQYAKQLPSSVDSLAAAIEANRIADHPVESYLGHPVKVRGFIGWPRRVHSIDLSGRVLPLLSNRTEPYDVQVMLGSD